MRGVVCSGVSRGREGGGGSRGFSERQVNYSAVVEVLRSVSPSI